ncbi:MAG: FliM/FliN family flagellar motor switch protein [Myxococcaceae bacterium]|nr:FliM/FliN family flagellar motor switch protein [Myxococcaceae bacterium]
MRDATTLVGPVPTPDPAPKVRARKVTLTPLKRFTRAHLELAARPSVRDDATSALSAALDAVGVQLGHSVTGTARLLDATLQPLQHLARESLFVVVELSHASAMAIVELEAPLFTHFLQHAAGADPRSRAVTSLSRIESAALGWLALSAIKGLRSIQSFEERFGPRLVTVTLDRGEVLRSVDSTVRHLAIELMLHGEHPLGGARVLVPAKLLQAAVQTAPRAEAPPAHEAVLAATLTAQTRFGVAQLVRADLGELSAGDVIVFAGSSLSEERLFGPARLLTSSFELAGELGPDGFTLTHITHPTQEPAMSNSLNVDVEIELTTIQVPVRQLGTIAPGSVLPLHINAAQTVTLRIDGRKVALAELVEVEGEIGARITAMLEPEAP